MATFITKERALSFHKGGGVQYIPGHIEPFIDYVLEKVLSDGKVRSALDLGGGGLRFALPASRYLGKITVVDLDADSIDVDTIISRINEVGNSTDCFRKDVIKPTVNSISSFIEKDELDFDMVLLSRVIHFMRPDETETLFKTLGSKLPSGSYVFVSSIVKLDKSTGQPNEYFRNTAPAMSEHYRKFLDTAEAVELRRRQNLPDCLHICETEYLTSLLGGDFNLLEEPLWATRTVQGFVFRKTGYLCNKRQTGKEAGRKTASDTP